MRDHVEAAFLVYGGLVRLQESGVHADVGGNRVFIHDFADDNHTFRTLDSIHRRDAHVGCVHVLHTPVVAGAAAYHIPPQVVHRDDLRGNFGEVRLGPDHLPNVTLVLNLQVASVIQRSDGAGPGHTDPHDGVLVGSMHRPHGKRLQVRVGPQTAVAARDIPDEFLFFDIAGIGEPAVCAI